MGDAAPEPMYVVYAPSQQRVFVGDRANDRVVAFDARTFEVDGIAPAGAGVFHMWGSRATGELWVNNDVDNTTSIIDARTLEIVDSFATPADLVALGGRPHDVIVDDNGFYGYITVIGVAGDNDRLLQVDARSHEIVRVIEVGDDPHVSLGTGNPYLYVPAQGSDTVQVFDQMTLDPITELMISGAHGAAMTTNGRIFYTTNLPGGGSDALWAIETATNTIVAAGVDTNFPVPHNIAVTPNGKKIFVTHSGPNTTVSVFETRGRTPMPTLVDEVTVGSNPFGIAYVP
jgi:DNA-binding beta-propeller fold protein YncE